MLKYISLMLYDHYLLYGFPVHVNSLVSAGSTRNTDSLEEMTKSLHRLPLGNSATSAEHPERCTHSSAHITVGTRRDVFPVQAKYEVQSVVRYEHSSCECKDYALKDDIGTLRKYSDTIWAVYLNGARVYRVPTIFAGCYC